MGTTGKKMEIFLNRKYAYLTEPMSCSRTFLVLDCRLSLLILLKLLFMPEFLFLPREKKLRAGL